MIVWKKINIASNEVKLYKEQKLHQEAWQLLYEVLENQYGIITNSESFEKNHFGKPYLVSHSEIHFNISHCEEMVACVISATDVGIDIEMVKPFPNGVMKKVCSIEEQESICKANNPEEQFFKLWTLKESYIKAVGKGLQLSMKNAVFHLGEDGTVERNPLGYTFKQKKIAGKYILSVCERR